MCVKECPILCIYSVPANSAINCGDPGTPTNGRHSLSSTTYNSVVTYTFDAGYALNIYSVSSAVDCGDPGTPLRAALEQLHVTACTHALTLIVMW